MIFLNWLLCDLGFASDLFSLAFLFYIFCVGPPPAGSDLGFASNSIESLFACFVPNIFLDIIMGNTSKQFRSSEEKRSERARSTCQASSDLGSASNLFSLALSHILDIMWVLNSFGQAKKSEAKERNPLQ